MGFFSRFNLMTTDRVVNDLVTRSINRARRAGQQQREFLRQMMIDFYENNQHAEDKYLRDFGFKERNTLPFVSEPLTQRVIDENSLVYDFAPERIVVSRDSGEAVDNDPYISFLADNPQIDFALEKLECYQNLLDNVLLRFEFDPFFNKIMAYIEPYYLPHFLEHNSLYPVAYSIPLPIDTNVASTSAPKDHFLFVSDKEMYIHDRSGNVVDDPRFPGRENPYGISTVIDVSDFPVSDYWHLAAKPLVDANLVLNVLQQVWSYTFQYEVFSQKTATGISKEIAETLKFGFDNVWWATDPQAEYRSLAPDVDLLTSMESIERWLSRVLDHYNVSMSFTERGSVVPAVTVKLRKGRLLKKFRKDVRSWKIVESRVRQVIGRIAMHHGLIGKIDFANTQIVVDFREPVWSVETQDDRDDWDWRVKRGLKTYRDLLRGENQDLTPDGADALLRDNLAYSNDFLALRRFDENMIVPPEPSSEDEDDSDAI